MASSLLSLKDRLALITGAASGIGLSCAELFVEHGACLIITDLNEHVLQVAKELQQKSDSMSYGCKIKGFICDISKTDHIQKLFDFIKIEFPEFKAASVLVNSAGVASLKPITETSEESLDQMISVNFKGTYMMTKFACKALMDNFSQLNTDETLKSNASIINLSSLAGTHGSVGFTNYGASKAAVLGLTKSLAKELGVYKIRTNAVLPFYTDTPILKVPAKVKKDLAEMNPMKRLAVPEDVARTVLFLASDMSSFINGAFVEVTGGVLL